LQQKVDNEKPDSIFQIPGVFDVRTFGAVGDGKTNDTTAILRAAHAAKAFGTGVVLLPRKGVYLSWPLVLSGMNNTAMCIEGVLLMPDKPQWPPAPCPTITAPCATRRLAASLVPSMEALRVQELSFVRVQRSSGFVLGGRGCIKGLGGKWWSARAKQPELFAPVLVLLLECHSCKLLTLRLRSSPFYHLVLAKSTDAEVHGLDIRTRKSSRNTDGISLYQSQGVRITDCNVSTGDDNLVLKEGTRDVLAERCYFRDGHGASIGSLGEANSTGSVRDVVLRNCTFVRTDNAARIKTWQGGHGEVRNITFEGIRLDQVSHPVTVNQLYCPRSQHPAPCLPGATAVQVSSVSFRKWSGTYSGSNAPLDFRCDPVKPCLDLLLEDIDLRPAEEGHAKASKAVCANAFGSVVGRVRPDSCLVTGTQAIAN